MSDLVVGSIRISATISYARRTNLGHIKGNLTAIRYRDEILQSHLLPVIGVQREMFQQDNVRPHNARVNMDFLVNHSINVLPRPSKSLDLDSIEHYWDELCLRLRRRQLQPQTLNELR